MTNHVVGRLEERMTGVVANPKALLDKVQAFANTCEMGKSYAVRARVLDAHHGDCKTTNINSRASNGDEVYVVVRHQRLVTVMFRRSNQPKRCDRFDTNFVIDLVSGIPVVLDEVATVQWRKSA